MPDLACLLTFSAALVEAAANCGLDKQHPETNRHRRISSFGLKKVFFLLWSLFSSRQYFSHGLHFILFCVHESRCCRGLTSWKHCRSKKRERGHSESPSTSCLLTATVTISYSRLSRSSNTWKQSKCVCACRLFSCTRIQEETTGY